MCGGGKNENFIVKKIEKKLGNQIPLSRKLPRGSPISRVIFSQLSRYHSLSRLAQPPRRLLPPATAAPPSDVRPQATVARRWAPFHLYHSFILSLSLRYVFCLELPPPHRQQPSAASVIRRSSPDSWILWLRWFPPSFGEVWVSVDWPFSLGLISVYQWHLDVIFGIWRFSTD